MKNILGELRLLAGTLFLAWACSCLGKDMTATMAVNFAELANELKKIANEKKDELEPKEL